MKFFTLSIAIMRQLLLVLCTTLCTLSALAQKVYTDTLQQKKGKGKVVIFQDDEIRNIVNNVKPIKATPQSTTPATSKPTSKPNTGKVPTKTTPSAPPTKSATATPATKPTTSTPVSTPAKPAVKVDTLKPQKTQEEASPLPYRQAGPRVQMQGYRIQIYSGGNSRQARATAMAMGRKCQDQYPELGVYTAFVSPRWVCYVGDFRTEAEAQAYVHRMRFSGAFRQATVVRSKVLVPRAQLSDNP